MPEVRPPARGGVHDVPAAAFLFAGWFGLLYAIAAVLLGGTAWFAAPLVESGIRAYHLEATRPDTVMVMVAAEPLQPGTTIEERHLYAVEIPPYYLPAGVYLSPEHLVGERVAAPILADDLIRSERLQ